MRVFLTVLLFLGVLCGPAMAGPRIERVVSASGVEAWLVREPKIPMLALQAVWRGGASGDAPGQEGRASLATALLTEGAGPLDAEAFQSALRDGAISLGFGSDRDFVSLSIRTLTTQRERAFELLRLALTAPRFDGEPVARLKAQAETAARRARTSPGSLGNEKFMALAFPDHPYGRNTSPQLESLPRLQATDFRAFTDAVLARRNLHVAVVGDITAEELARLLDESFGKLPAEPAIVPTLKVTSQVAPKPVIVPFANPQSLVLFGAPGLVREDPDYYAASLLNYVLGGGGFNSRLMEEIREKRGLVYNVSTQLHPMQASGMVMGSLSTRNDQVAEALKLVRANLRQVATEGISSRELAEAKAYLTGSFPLRLGSNAAIAGMVSAMQVSGLGMDYIERYPQFIEAVTAADIKRVAARLFGDDRLLVVVVGQPTGMEE